MKVVDDLRTAGSVPYYHNVTVAAYEELCKTFEHVMGVFANGAGPVA